MMMEYFFATATGNNKNDCASHFKKESNDNRRKQNKHQRQARCYPLFFIKGVLFIPDNRQRQDQKEKEEKPVHYNLSHRLPRRLTVTG